MNIIDFWKEFVSTKTHYSQFEKEEFLQALDVNVPDWKEQIRNKEIWPNLHTYGNNVGETAYMRLIIEEAGLEFACFLVETGGCHLDDCVALDYCTERIDSDWNGFTDVVKGEILKCKLHEFTQQCLASPKLWNQLTFEQKTLVLSELEHKEKSYVSDILIFNIWSKELDFKRSQYVHFVTNKFKHLKMELENREEMRMDLRMEREIEMELGEWDIPVVSNEHGFLRYNASRKLEHIERVASMAGDADTMLRTKALKEEIEAQF